ncbi:MAG: sulfatase-like hydrolase/transferase [Planctomycetota bacterium]|jgi:arylsulfatase A-like enzyme/Flp pilus assembly protein TadD
MREKLKKRQPFLLWRRILLGLVVVITIVALWLLMRPDIWSKNIRHILLISIDTCRADRLNCYGFGRKTTPTIDAIAQEGILFKNALAPVPLTLPAHCSILTGTYPPYHKVHDNLNYRLSDANITLGELLREQGYITGAIVSAFVLDRQFGLAQGFDSYNDRFEQPIGPREHWERRGEEASQFACSYLEQHKNEPFFLFLHYFDPHTDYEPPEPFATTYADDLYSGEIAYTDHCIDQVIEKLKSLDLYDSALIIIVGDHGEGLGEHGEAAHGYYIYEGMIKIPFIIRPPRCRKPKKIDDVVSLVDVVPTILSYLGIPTPGHVQGRDLSGYSTGNALSEQKRYVYCESLTATTYGCNPLLGLVGKRWKYIETTRPELYDLFHDPLEKNNLLEKEAKRARFMQGQLQEMITQLAGDELDDSKLVLDEESRRRLESLGYVAIGAVDASLQLVKTSPDPKDFIRYHESIEMVVDLIAHLRFNQAKVICEKMLVEWPHMPETHLQLGRITFEKSQLAESITYNTQYLELEAQRRVQNPESLVSDPNKLGVFMVHDMLSAAYCQLEQYDKAVEHYTAMLRIKSNLPSVHNSVAEALFNLGEIDQAIKHWTEALRLKPNWPEVHNNLATAFYKQGKIDKAMAHYTEALRLKPDWAEVRNNLYNLAQRKKRDQEVAQYTEMLQRNPNDAYIHDKLASVFYNQGKADQAIKHWTVAVRLKPQWAEAHSNLATACYRQGKVEHAVKHWTVAVQLKPNLAIAHSNLAWLLATVEDEKLRNPDEAVRLAERACELTGYKHPGILDVLGVAYAAVGRFAEAVKTAEKALDLARSTEQKELAAQIQEHLELFKSGQPYSEARQWQSTTSQ